MDREPIPGECVVVTRNTGDHGARVGERYIVSRVDDGDDTIKAIPRGSSTVADYWIPWSDIEPVGFGWEYARGHLPDDVAALLAAGIPRALVAALAGGPWGLTPPEAVEAVGDLLERVDRGRHYATRPVIIAEIRRSCAACKVSLLPSML